MQYYDVKSTAKLLGVSEVTVRRMVKRGDLRCRRFGRLVRIPASELELPTAPIPLHRAV